MADNKTDKKKPQAQYWVDDQGNKRDDGMYDEVFEDDAANAKADAYAFNLAVKGGWSEAKARWLIYGGPMPAPDADGNIK